MKARRIGTMAGLWATVAAGALALVGTVPATAAPATATPAATAQAEKPVPTYRCVLLETHELPFAVGRHCEAHHGAPQEGPIFGRFVIESPRQSVVCDVFRPFSGHAKLPDRVEGHLCERIDRPGSSAEQQ